jgi:hypothetical protein
MMRPYALLPLLLLGSQFHAQDLGDRRLVLQEITIPDMPGIQSFAWGQHAGEWLLIGGRTDGLHRRQPFAAFLATDNNTMAYVVDPTTEQVWSASLSALPTPIHEQLQCTNMEFEMRGNTLYIIGGYGFSPTANDHITHSKLTAVDVPGAITAIKTGGSLAPHFRQINDARMAVTGGYLGLLNDEFYLVGGQRFIGRYNPMGPDFGPGFVQEYTNAIRRFRIGDDGTSLSLIDFVETVDTANLHRRDYNLVYQVFPGGATGFTAFSGVFQYGVDLPWLNTVDITPEGYTVVPDFEQLLNQYHTAHLPAWSATQASMSTVFFGGIGQYYFDGNGQLWNDENVPFVNTISRVRRASDGGMSEVAIGSMPALLGAGAEFIIEPDVPQLEGGILDLDALSGDTVLAGHIVGGITSSAANIFFVNTGTQSDASTRVFRVLLVRDITTGTSEPTRPAAPLRAWTGDADQLVVETNVAEAGLAEMVLLDSSGRKVRTLFAARMPAGTQRIHSAAKDLAAGRYVVELRINGQRWTTSYVR